MAAGTFYKTPTGFVQVTPEGTTPIDDRTFASLQSGQTPYLDVSTNGPAKYANVPAPSNTDPSLTSNAQPTGGSALPSLTPANTTGNDPISSFNQQVFGMLQDFSKKSQGINDPFISQAGTLQKQGLYEARTPNDVNTDWSKLSPADEIAQRKASLTSNNPIITSLEGRMQQNNNAITNFNNMLQNVNQFGEKYMQSLPVPEEVARGYAQAIRAGDFSILPTDPLAKAKAIQAVTKMDPHAFEEGAKINKPRFDTVPIGKDIYGQTFYGKLDKVTGQVTPISGGGGGSPVPSGFGTPTGGGTVVDNPKVPFGQYGLLSQTNFDPKNSTDSAAYSYLQSYLNGQAPTRPNNVKNGLIFDQNANRARDLFYAATGQTLPNPDVIAASVKLIAANNQLANTLKVQESTVKKNFGLNLENLNANNLNSSWPILNNIINGISNAFGDPATAQYLLQNSTIQQEAANLLAVKNAAGTTVFDKMTAAGLIPKNASKEQQVVMMKTLLQEAENSARAINEANASIYQQIDPLLLNANNPLRASYQPSASTGSGKTLSNDEAYKLYMQSQGGGSILPSAGTANGGISLAPSIFGGTQQTSTRQY